MMEMMQRRDGPIVRGMNTADVRPKLLGDDHQSFRVFRASMLHVPQFSRASGTLKDYKLILRSGLEGTKMLDIPTFDFCLDDDTVSLEDLLDRVGKHYLTQIGRAHV